MHDTANADLIIHLDPAQVLPWNSVQEEKVDALAASMRRDGWLGRPLLVVEDSQGIYRALTGSSRLAAACRTLDTVPAVVLDAEELALDCDGEDVYMDGARVADIDSLQFELSKVDSEDARVAVAHLSAEYEANAQEEAAAQAQEEANAQDTANAEDEARIAS